MRYQTIASAVLILAMLPLTRLGSRALLSLFLVMTPTAIAIAIAIEMWFGAVSNLPTAKGFGTDPDYVEALSSPARWPTVFARMHTILMTTHYVMTQPEDDLRKIFANLNAHHVGVAFDGGFVTATDCGSMVEGMLRHPGTDGKAARVSKNSARTSRTSSPTNR